MNCAICHSAEALLQVSWDASFVSISIAKPRDWHTDRLMWIDCHCQSPLRYRATFVLPMIVSKSNPVLESFWNLLNMQGCIAPYCSGAVSATT